MTTAPLIGRPLSPANPACHGSWARWAFVLICLPILLAERELNLFQPYWADGGIFVYMGKLVAEGGRVGIEMVDNKFPTVGLLVSGAWRLLGPAWPGYVLLQTAMVIGATAMLARAASRSVGRWAAIPTAVGALAFLNFHFAVDGGFRLETLIATFSTIAAAAALLALAGDDPRDAFLVGLAAGTGAMIKPSGLAPLAAFAVVTLLSLRRPGRKLAHASAAAAGAAVPLAVTLAYLYGADLLARTPAIWGQVARYAAGSRWDVWDLGKWMAAAVIFGFPLIVRAIVFRRVGHRVAGRAARPLVAFAALWLGFEAAAVLAGGRMYSYHFLALAAPSALLFGMIPRDDRPLPLAAALALPVGVSLFGIWMVAPDAERPSRTLAVTEYLRAHARPGDAVWQDAMPRLLIETNLRPGSRYPLTFLWANDDAAAAELGPALLKDFDDRKPRFVILPAHVDSQVADISLRLKELEESPLRQARYARAWQDLDAYVHRRYRAEAEIGGQTIYRLADAD